MKQEHEQMKEQLAKEKAQVESVRQMQALHMREILALKNVERDLVLSIGATEFFLKKHGGEK